MALVTTKEMFAKAYAGGYAIGAFNINNMEIIQAVADACAEEKSPVILQVSTSALKYAKLPYLRAMVDAAIEDTGIDIALHLDHGPDFEACKMCVDGGFTSVMIDGSSHPFKENIEITKRVVDYAHAHGVTVEGELGKLAGVEDDVNVSAEDSTYTHPAEAEEFVKATGVDSLAIAIGTSHGAYKFKGEAKLRFDILDEVAQRLPGFPIVLHGASGIDPAVIELINKCGGKIDGAAGVPAEMLRRAASGAVCKINMDSDIRLALTAGIRETFVNEPSVFDPRKYLGHARDMVKVLVKDKIENVLGSNNRA